MNKEQIERTIGLLGEQVATELSKKRIAVIGLGGVGGTALEALARTGFENFVIVDGDVVSSSNLNRQILYTYKDISKTKVCVAEERIKAINPEADVVSINERIGLDNINKLKTYKIDMIVDAIDDISGKIAITQFAFENNIPVIVSLGMANRIDPSLVQVTRLDKTTNDPLAKKFRYELKYRGVDTSKVMAVCSKELPVKDNGKLHSIMTVPSSAGLNIAKYVITYFMK